MIGGEKQMTNILKILGVLGALVPLILTLIKQFETPGFGAEKKQVILDAIGSIYDSVEITFISKVKLLGIAGNFIDIAVAFFNVVGWFKKGNPTPST